MTLDAPPSPTLQVESDLEALDTVLSWFETFNRPDIPKEVWIQFQSALAEAFTNAVRHAHRDRPPDTPIALYLMVEASSLTLEIIDCGEPFDLLGAIAQLPDGVDRKSGGGRGLRIMDRVADRLSYERLPDGRNRLELVKSFEPVSEDPG